MTIDRTLALLVVLTTLCAGTRLDVANAQTTQPPAAATQKQEPVAELRGEWRRAGEGFACDLGARQRLDLKSLKPEVMMRACLQMGPLAIGADAKTLPPLLGAPARVVPQPKGASSMIYFLEDPDRYPYLVVTVQQERIVALQVTGHAPVKNYSFNHIDLGASPETLIKVFGPARHLQTDSQKGLDLWSYLPWTFSFEFKDNHVFSIRIADPELK